MEALIAAYGYLFIFVGTFLEGETILIIAGFLSHRGYIHLPYVIAAALAGSFFGDQLYFFIGRYRGKKILEKHPVWNQRVDRFMVKFNKYNMLVVVSFRFLYGFRTIAPFAIGLSGISGLRFFILNLFSAAIWAISFGCAGYIFGYTLERIINDVKQFELIIISGIIAVAISITLIKSLRQNRLKRKMKEQ